MIVKQIDHMNLDQIAGSGQAFRWIRTQSGAVSIVYRDYSLEIKEKEEGVFVLSCDDLEWEKVWKDYFDLETDYCFIENQIGKSGDEHLKEAFKLGRGIRILRQDLWEMIVTFMISQNNNITRITKSVDELCKRGGIEVKHASFLEKEGERRYRFPLPGEIKLEEFDDKTLGLGYRNEYLRGIYKYCYENPDWIEKLSEMNYKEAFETLLKIKGIGKKVANCICLFGLHHVEAFPVDTHVKQLLEKYYQKGFDFQRFNGYAGIIQQYLFYYELKNK